MPTYDALRDLELVVENVSFERRERPTSSGFTRVTTIIELTGDGATGRGEDVTYETDHHDTLQDQGPWDLTGSRTLREFSDLLEGVELFPDEPERPPFTHYRRWGVESAALDLALRQADTTLGDRLARDPRDPNFVVSTSITDDPERIWDLLEAAPELEFKLDPTAEWSDDLVASITETDAVRILDLKDQYGDADFTDDNPIDLYHGILEAFPDAIVEDPAITAETSDLVEAARNRVSWDAPIHGIADAERLPWKPTWLNVKPSRFGTLESLFDFLDWTAENDVSLYGGGQFELDVGRTQIQELAAVFYPDGPNDIAPIEYNDPGVPAAPATPPIEMPHDWTGFGWAPK